MAATVTEGSWWKVGLGLELVLRSKSISGPSGSRLWLLPTLNQQPDIPVMGTRAGRSAVSWKPPPCLLGCSPPPSKETLCRCRLAHSQPEGSPPCLMYRAGLKGLVH